MFQYLDCIDHVLTFDIHRDLRVDSDFLTSNALVLKNVRHNLTRREQIRRITAMFLEVISNSLAHVTVPRAEVQNT